MRIRNILSLTDDDHRERCNEPRNQTMADLEKQDKVLVC